MSTLSTALDTAITDPQQALGVIYDHLESCIGDMYFVPSPVTPFTYLLEAMVLTASSSLRNHIALVDKGTPYRALSEADMYRFLPDKATGDIMAIPAQTDGFLLFLPISEIQKAAVWNPVTGTSDLVMPRYTAITTNGLGFLMEYPIVISQLPDNTYAVYYDLSVGVEDFKPASSAIQYGIQIDSAGVKWLAFNVSVRQLNVQVSHYTASISEQFNKTITVASGQKPVRVDVWVENDAGWTQLKVAYHRYAYDSNKLTAIVTFTNTEVNVEIPYSFILGEQVIGRVRVDVLTCDGYVNVRLDDRTVDNFTFRYVEVDPDRDNNVYTAAFFNASPKAICPTWVNGGRAGLSLEEKRTRIINGTVGDKTLPVVGDALYTVMQDRGFFAQIKVDVFTQRIVTYTRRLPVPATREIPLQVTVGSAVIPIRINMPPTLPTVFSGNRRITILHDTLFQLTDDGLAFVRPEDNALITSGDIKAAVTYVNANAVMAALYTTQLSVSEKGLEVANYEFNRPALISRSLVDRPAKYAGKLYADTMTVTYTPAGYDIHVSVKCDPAVLQELLTTHVTAKLKGSDIPDYLYRTGTLAGNNSSTLVYKFTLPTNWEINRDKLSFLWDSDMSTSRNWLGLITNLEFTLEVTEPTTELQVTAYRESFVVKFGTALINMHVPSRSFIDAASYPVYQEDVYARYKTTDFERDAAGSALLFSSDSVSYRTLHKAGDLMLGEDGRKIILHARGERVVDENGIPLEPSDILVRREVHLPVYDAKFKLANRSDYVQNMEDMRALLLSWQTGVNDVRKKLLDKTELKFTVPNNIGKLAIIDEGGATRTVNAHMRPTVKLHVGKVVYNDTGKRAVIEQTVFELLLEYLKNTTFNRKTMHDTLHASIRDTVTQLEITGVYDGIYSCKTIDESSYPTIEGEAVLSSDGVVTVVPHITFIFVLDIH